MKMLRVVVFVGVIIGLLGVVPLAVEAGNDENARRCIDDYHDLMRSDGSRFGSVGECVEYAAHGGELEIIPTISVMMQLEGGAAVAYVTGEGFTPNTPVAVEISVTAVDGSTTMTADSTFDFYTSDSTGAIDIVFPIGDPQCHFYGTSTITTATVTDLAGIVASTSGFAWPCSEA